MKPGPTACAECGAPIKQRPQRPTRYYCHPRCQRRAWRKRNPKPARARPTHCGCCGKPLPEPVSRVGGPRLFCGQKCQQKAARNRLLPPPRPSCEWCGGPLGEPLRRDRRFCCDAHRQRARDERKRRSPPPSAREQLVLMVGWPGAQRLPQRSIGTM